MTALTKPRRTNRREGDLYSLPVAADAVILQGALVALNATGYATKGATSATLTAAGRAAHSVDNTGGADGAMTVEVEPGVFGYVADASVTQAYVGKTVYILDDQTVHATDGTGARSAAGTLVELEGTTAWVRIGF